MSRHIQTTDPNSRKLNNQSQNGKLILTKLNDRFMSLLLQNDVLISAQVISHSNPDKIGEIYIGKVKNVLPNINAYFVEIADGEMCYLSFKDAEAAYVLNRNINSSSNSPVRLVQGDELPVQVIRNALKTKPAAVSAALELQSEYFVFKAGDSGLGISNKINKARTREIRRILEEEKNLTDFQEHYSDTSANISSNNPDSILKPTDFTVIARTNCSNLDNERLAEEYEKQYKAFCEIFQKARYRTCYSCLLDSASPVLAAVQRISTCEYDEIITDIPEFYEALKSASIFAEPVLPNPDHTKSVRYYNDASISLASLYGLQTKLENASGKKVWMKSGANLIIEQTECLTTIDVNSGKNIKGKVSEDMIFQVNKEAAKEAAVQIRLRNLSGIIIIDFINMKDKKHEEELLAYLGELVSKDPVTTVVVDMTSLGLVEITRKKILMSLQEQLHEIC